MKLYFSALFAASASFLLLSLNAGAQIMTDDLFILKAGYIPYGVSTFDKGVSVGDVESPDSEIDDVKTSPVNFAAKAEYNIIFGIFRMGLGIEYQRISVDEFAIEDTEFETFNNDFVLPEISFKFDIFNGLYTGLGASGKYLLSTDRALIKGTEDDPVYGKFGKKIDLWGNYIIGYNLRISEYLSINFEGRTGYNITNNQYDKITIESPDGTELEKYKLTPKQAYDSAVYIGIGMKPSGLGY